MVYLLLRWNKRIHAYFCVARVLREVSRAASFAYSFGEVAICERGNELPNWIANSQVLYQNDWEDHKSGRDLEPRERYCSCYRARRFRPKPKTISIDIMPSQAKDQTMVALAIRHRLWVGNSRFMDWIEYEVMIWNMTILCLFYSVSTIALTTSLFDAHSKFCLPNARFNSSKFRDWVSTHPELVEDWS